MSKPRPITQTELKAIRQSVREASLILTKRMGIEAFDRKARGRTKTPKWQIAQERWLLCLRWLDGRIPWLFNDSSSKEIVLRAMDNYDLDFFIKLGRILKKNNMPLLEFGADFTPTTLPA